MDTLCDLLIDMVNRVPYRAEVKVERELIADGKRVSSCMLHQRWCFTLGAAERNAAVDAKWRSSVGCGLS